MSHKCPQQTLHSIDEDRGLKTLGGAYIFTSVALGLHFFHGAVANLILILLTIAVCLHWGRRMRTEIALHSHDWAYLIYIVFLLFSAAWSISYPATFEQAIPLALPWVATFLLSPIPAEWAVEAVIKIALVAAILSPCVILLSGKLAYQPVSSTGAPELRGVFVHQLYLGAFMFIVLGLALLKCMNQRKFKILNTSVFLNVCIVVALLVALFMSRTRLYVITGVLALLLTILLSRRGSMKWVFANLIAVTSVLLALSFSTIVADLDVIGFDTTLTGRTRIWERTLDAVGPPDQLLGFGFGSFQLPYFDHLFGVYRPPHAHNSFIQSYFETGQIGLTILIVLIVMQLVSASRSSARTDQYSYSLFLILFCLLGSVTGGVIYAGALTTPFCIMLLFLAIESRTITRDPPHMNGSRVTQVHGRLPRKHYSAPRHPV